MDYMEKEEIKRNKEWKSLDEWRKNEGRRIVII